MPSGRVLKVLFGAVYLGIALLFTNQPRPVLGSGLEVSEDPEEKSNEKTDDWKYKPHITFEFGGAMNKRGGFNMARSAMPMASPMMKMAAAPVAFQADSAALGFAVGGSKDVSNFRENIKKGYLPLPTDVTYEGIFYDYFFETGQQQQCKKLFCPSFSLASSADPISKKSIKYMTVGLNSGLTESTFHRRPLNLMVVLDISGSMSSPFDDYHYSRRNRGEESETETKLKLATKSLASMVDHLNAEDRLGIVLFDHDAYLAKPFRTVGTTDMASIKKHLLEVQPAGATNMEAGLRMAVANFKELGILEGYDNRIIFLTDAMPNTGNIDENELLQITKEAAANKIYSTFVGIGLDFQSELIESITKVKGANYFSVHNGKEFNEKINEEFDLIVTPLVFDLSLKFESTFYEIEKVYGSPEAAQAKGDILYVNTLFPSRTSEEGTKGGVILVRLKEKEQPTGADDKTIRLTASYSDRDGHADKDVAEIPASEWTTSTGDFYENTGIRKAILLVRYVDMLKHWLTSERLSQPASKPTIPISYLKFDRVICPTTGIPPFIVSEGVGKWERTSVKLCIGPQTAQLWETLRTEYFGPEKAALQDETLDQEAHILKAIAASRADKC